MHSAAGNAVAAAAAFTQALEHAHASPVSPLEHAELLRMCARAVMAAAEVDLSPAALQRCVDLNAQARTLYLAANDVLGLVKASGDEAHALVLLQALPAAHARLDDAWAALLAAAAEYELPLNRDMATLDADAAQLFVLVCDRLRDLATVRGLACEAQGDESGAMAALRQARDYHARADRDPDAATLGMLLAREASCLQRLGRFAEAAASFAQADVPLARVHVSDLSDQRAVFALADCRQRHAECLVRHGDAPAALRLLDSTLSLAAQLCRDDATTASPDAARSLLGRCHATRALALHAANINSNSNSSANTDTNPSASASAGSSAEPSLAAAIASQEAALAARVALHGGMQHASVAATLAVLGQLQREHGNISAARGALAQAQQILRALHADEADHPSLAEVYLQQGFLARDQGDAAAAAKFYRLGLAARARAGTPADDVEGVALQRELVLLLVQTDQLVAATTLFESLPPLPEDDLSLAAADLFCAVGFAYQQANRTAPALRCFERALATRRALLGPSHALVAAVVNNVAAVQLARGLVDSAADMFAENIARVPGTEEAARALCNLAHVHARQKRFAEAAACLEQALAIYRTVLGPEHPRVGWLLVFFSFH
jgi:tetratricopeptide (TPR) repeat protein